MGIFGLILKEFITGSVDYGKDYVFKSFDRHHSAQNENCERGFILLSRGFEIDVNTSVFVSRELFRCQYPILGATHASNGTWHFFSNRDCENIIRVPLKYLIDIDPTLAEVCTLPPNYSAKRFWRTGGWHVIKSSMSLIVPER